MNNLLNPFSFILPTRIEYGPDVLAKLPQELAALGITKTLIVTDEGIVKAGLVAKLTDLLDEAQVSYYIFDEVAPNPKDVNVEAGAKAASQFGAKAIIALGGGSPIDCAKAIGALLAHNATSIKLYEGKTAVNKKIPPLFTIPTTSGSGSEVTFSAVITDTINNYKMTVKSPLMAATAAFLDPNLTVTLPSHVTAATGMDALTHAIEAYTAKVAEPISDGLALYAIELINNHLKTAVKDGSNLEARAGMLLGSLLAGLAFSHSDVASVHCMAESLGSLYDAPHGVCNAILLPFVMEYSMEYCQDRYAQVAKAMGAEFASEAEGAAKAVALVKQLAADVDLPAFKSLQVAEADLAILAEMSAANISTESNPRPMAKDDYLTVFKNAYLAS
ncbi:MAG: iron-containing alcohol dehydrogenase [Bacillota bacterium]|nr:iron-containing alcohol dehydrogenase [Bacillota bacterium]